ncbi:RICIN domain-containing protein [Streptomyces sp. NPDC000410]|uniref:RICIN domain-containing protein n=1 Tax=Streptomyces sp. NPDC000410 TaxID=3154254 RepID=UPI00332CB97C
MTHPSDSEATEVIARVPGPVETTRPLPRVEEPTGPAPYGPEDHAAAPARRGLLSKVLIGVAILTCAGAGLGIGAVRSGDPGRHGTVGNGAPAEAPADEAPAPSASPSAEKPPVAGDKPYVMVNELTGKAADIQGGSSEDGTLLIAYERHGGENQQWLFSDMGDGYVNIASVGSGKCLQVDGQPAPGRNVTQQPCADTDSQLWNVAADGSSYTVTAKGSQLLLVNSSDAYEGNELLQLGLPDPGGPQTWTLQPVE